MFPLAATDTAASSAKVGVYLGVTPIFQHLGFVSPLNDASGVWGRTMFNSIFLTPDFGLSFYGANMQGGTRAMRADYVAGAFYYTWHNWLLDGSHADVRHSVSGDLTKGAAVISLLSDYYGEEPYLEWSNFGSYEQLAMPPQISAANGVYASVPELIVGVDGRLHIIYHDLATDNIKVISTL
jgi:hypothetical protein